MTGKGSLYSIHQAKARHRSYDKTKQVKQDSGRCKLRLAYPIPRSVVPIIFSVTSVFHPNFKDMSNILSLQVQPLAEAYIKSSQVASVTRKKSPNVYKSCPKRISLEQLKILTTLQKLPKNVGDLGKSTVAKGFKKLPKVQ